MTLTESLNDIKKNMDVRYKNIKISMYDSNDIKSYIKDEALPKDCTLIEKETQIDNRNCEYEFIIEKKCDDDIYFSFSILKRNIQNELSDNEKGELWEKLNKKIKSVDL